MTECKKMYLKYGYKELTSENIISTTLVLSLLALLPVFIPGGGVFYRVFVWLLVAIYIITMVYVWPQRTRFPYACCFANFGMQSALAYLLIITDCAVLWGIYYNGKAMFFTISILFGVAMAYVLSRVIMKSINAGKMPLEDQSRSISFFSIFGVLGMILARVFIGPSAGNKLKITIIIGCLMVIAFILVVGTLSFLKVFLIKQTPNSEEILVSE